jgi:hypothetical protein
LTSQHIQAGVQVPAGTGFAIYSGMTGEPIQPKRSETMVDNLLNCRCRSGHIQATRKEEAKPLVIWELETPQGWVACKDLDGCRELAADYGCTILL